MALKHQDYLNQEREGIFDKPEFRFDSKGRVVIPFPGKDNLTLSVTPGSKIISQGSSTYTNKPMTDPASLRTGRLYAETVIQIGNSIYLDALNECITVGKDGLTQWIMDSEYLRGIDRDDTIFGFFLQDTKIKEGEFSKGDVLIGNYPSSYIRYDNSNRRLLIVGDLAMAGDVASTNFITGVSGYKLEYLTGNAEFNDIYVRGGTVAGWIVGNTEMSYGNVYIQSTAERILLGLATAPLTGVGIFIGKDGSDYEFRAGNPSGNYIHWTGSALNITGSITATSGSIGSFTVGTYLYTGTKIAYNDSNAGVHLGSDGIGIGDNVFTVSSAGALVATSATITGAITASSGSVGSFTIGTYLYTGSKTAYNDTNAGVHLGSDGIGIGNNVFTVSSAGALVATSATITGAITASSGSIGSFTIGTYLYTGSKTAYNDANAGVHLGSDGIGIANNLFTVSAAGVITAVSGTIGGCVLAATSIGSTVFTSGPLGSGWNISNAGNVEFQNATIRGIIRTSVFEKDTISAVNGIVLVSSADVLNADMTALDNSTVTITGQTTFVANEVIRIKDGTDDEWMLVTNAASAPVYTVTRDLAGNYTADTNPIWKKGTAVVSMGVGTGTKTGFILLDSSSANSPYIDVYGRNSNTYNDYTLHGRFGWLKGITDANVGLNSTDVWGLYTDNAYITGVVNATSGKFGTTTNYWSVGATGLTAVVDGTDVVIKYGKTDFGQDSTDGFIIGYDYSATKPKFEFGDSDTSLLKYDGTNFSLVNGVITGGSIAIGTGDAIFKADSSGIYLGDATFADAPFNVDMAGNAKVKSLQREDWHWMTLFESLDGYQVQGDAGYVADVNSGLRLVTHSDNGDSIEIAKFNDAAFVNDFSWAQDKTINFCIGTQNDGDSSLFHARIGTGPTTDTYYQLRHIGILLDGLAVYGSVGNGSTETTLDLGYNLSTNSYYNIIIKFIAGTSVEFFINGDSKGTITTNLPTGTTHASWIFGAYAETEQAYVRELWIPYFDFWQALN